MATYSEPIERQPEFDDVQPLAADHRLFLRVIGPIIQLTQLFTAPGQLYQNHRAPRGDRSRPASPEEWASLPTVGQRYVDAAERALSMLGFGPARHEVTPTTSTAFTYASHLFNPATRELASIFVGVAPRRFVQACVAVQTWWDDGRRTVTNNMEGAELFASLHRPRNVDSLALPGLEDIPRLYMIHRARCAERAGRQPIGDGWDDPVHNPKALFRIIAEEWQQRVVESGLYRIESHEAMRLQWKGAILMTWSRLPPFRQYLAWQGRQRTEEALGRYS